ncbi:NAD(P)-binding protein [Choiromyces venosus 120613-1]|uniref:enoyl-[acyl-carrier-protein] reductase n=1 Tax=Choiromyces venosus 120613-1 TaxID=1336337 RepID=A0A3N4JRT7_9PEZI|nr:NAD(P)-binding protein [Choiromyces venosus 120613-1]
MFSLRTPLQRTLLRPASTIPKRHITVFGYTQAKALIFSEHGPPKDVLKLHSYSISPAYGDEITVRFLAAPINPADINQIEGVYPSKPTFTTTLGTPTPHAVPGNEAAVQVLSVGPSVTDFAPGDMAIMRHTAFGTWRTHATARSSNLLKVPESPVITPLQAATVSVNPCTAYRMLKDFVPLRAGDWFVQNAANSGVGRAALQFGRMWGLKSVNVIRHREGVEELKRELEELGGGGGGGGVVVLTDRELADSEVRKGVIDRMGGKGAMLGLNSVGGKAGTDLCKLLDTGGHLVTYGAMSKKPLTLAASLLIFKDLHFHGFWVSRWSDQHPSEKEAMLDDIFNSIASGELKDVPMEVTVWRRDTKEEELKAAIERSTQGFSSKKQIFVFEDE